MPASTKCLIDDRLCGKRSDVSIQVRSFERLSSTMQPGFQLINLQARLRNDDGLSDHRQRCQRGGSQSLLVNRYITPAKQLQLFLFQSRTEHLIAEREFLRAAKDHCDCKRLLAANSKSAFAEEGPK